MRKNKKLTISWCCFECGGKYGDPKAAELTYFQGTCDVCTKESFITHIRNYSYLPKLEEEETK